MDPLLQHTAQAHRGYESKGFHGKFMFMFANANDAVAFACAANKALLTLDWDPATLAHADMAEQSTDDGQTYIRGPGLAVGMSTGSPAMYSFNRVSGRMDYFGPVVNRAARILGQTVAGEICLSDATREALSVETLDEILMETCGMFNLRGINEELVCLGGGALSQTCGLYPTRDPQAMQCCTAQSHPSLSRACPQSMSHCLSRSQPSPVMPKYSDQPAARAQRNHQRKGG